MFLYVIQAGENEVYKIGVSNNVNRRIKELQTGNHESLHLIHQIHVDIDVTGLEDECHKRLDEYRTNGEWFNTSITTITSVLIDVVKRFSSYEYESDSTPATSSKHGRLLQPKRTSIVIDLNKDNWRDKWKAYQASPSYTAYIILDDDKDTGFGFSVGMRVSHTTRKNKKKPNKTYIYKRLYAVVNRANTPSKTIELGHVGKCASVDLIEIGEKLRGMIHEHDTIKTPSGWKCGECGQRVFIEPATHQKCSFCNQINWKTIEV
jgi:hypothetical protein